MHKVKEKRGGGVYKLMIIIISHHSIIVIIIISVSLLQFTFQAAKVAAGCVNEITEHVVSGKVCYLVTC